MCSRYWVDRAVDEELEQMNIGFHPDGAPMRHDIRPSEPAWIIGHGPESAELRVVKDRWGYLSYDQKLIINARAESVFDRKMFREGAIHHRIAVPASGFYEWNAAKEKSSFQRPDGVLFMAGLADIFGGTERFVIITTAANDSMKPVHDRMPLILEKDQLEDWILDDGMTEKFLRQIPVNLDRQSDYEQMSLFDA